MTYPASLDHGLTGPLTLYLRDVWIRDSELEKNRLSKAEEVRRPSATMGNIHFSRAFAVSADKDELDRLLSRAADGDRESWGALLSVHRDRLVRMISLRLDDRLAGRLDPSDVIQEAYLEASTRLQEYLDRPDVPFFIWLRFLTGQKLAGLHRHHLGVHKRNAAREVPIEFGGAPATTSVGLAERLIGREPRPSEALAKDELRRRFVTALDALDPIDREIIALRHYEQLTNVEAASVLGLQESAASKRYIRALDKLRACLSEFADSVPGVRP